MQSKPILSCDVIHKHSLFRHGFIKKSKSKFNRIENRRILFWCNGFRTTDLGIDLMQMLFEGRYKTQDYFRYFLDLFPVPSFNFSKNGRGLILVYPQRTVWIIHYLYSKDGFTYGHSIQYKMLLFVYIYIDLLKLKAYKLFENCDADLSWLLFFKEANLYTTFVTWPSSFLN